MQTVLTLQQEFPGSAVKTMDAAVLESAFAGSVRFPHGRDRHISASGSSAPS